MPLTEKGHEIEANMKKEYGEKKGESVFYASKNAGKISGVDEIHGKTPGPFADPIPKDAYQPGGVNSIPVGAGYDAERIGFKSIAAQNPVEKRMEERRKAVERGEDPYKRLNEEMREQSKDSVPLGKCYQDDVPPAVMSGDPVISPTSTSQYSGMQEQMRTAPQPGPVEPVDAKGEFEKGARQTEEALRQLGGSKKIEVNEPRAFSKGAAQTEEAMRALGHHDNKSPIVSVPPMSDLDAFARLGAGGDAWSEMTGRHDFSGDGNSSMGNLPEQVGFGEIKRMGAGFNYNQGYNRDPYKK